MSTPVKNLLDHFEKISNDHEELFDSEVRQRMRNAIMEGFVRNREDYEVPLDFGMFSEEGNAAVRIAICDFVAAAKRLATDAELESFHQRLGFLQDGSVHSESGNDYEEFLGHSRPDFFDQDGNLIRLQ